MKYIYSRVSSDDQNIDGQVSHLVDKHPKAEVHTEVFTGTTLDRPVFKNLLDKLVSGDMLIVREVSRLGRNTIEVLEVCDKLKQRKVSIHIDDLGGMDITSPAGEMMLTMLSAIAKMERETMRERQRIGIEEAKKKGKYKGRKPIDHAVIKHAQALIKEGMSKKDVSRQLKISIPTLYRYLPPND